MAARAKPLLDFPVFFERDHAGGYVVVCPALPGCYSQGETIDEAEQNTREAILLCLEDMEANGEPLPQAGVSPAS